MADIKLQLSKGWQVLKATWQKFNDENTMRHAAALAYYTIFSLPPILIVIIHASSLFLDKNMVQNAIVNQVRLMAGQKGAKQLADTINKSGFLQASMLKTAFSLFMLFLSSTSLFLTIQGSLNSIFKVKARPKLGYKKMLRDRAISFGIIVLLSVILLGSLMLEAAIKLSNHYINETLPHIGAKLIHLTSNLLIFGLLGLFFALIFKYLPDAKIKWRDTIVGALVTSLLYSIGKLLISYYISKTHVGNIYDAAGSILIILVWIFYTSAIFFFGAQFTYVYARFYGTHIRPASYAVRIVQRELAPDEEE